MVSLFLERAGATAQLMDQLSYGYNRDEANQLTNNRLRHVKDGAGKFGENIGSQADDNYTYDAMMQWVAKVVSGGSDPKRTYYVRGASGLVMSVYERKASVTTLTQFNLHSLLLK